MFQCLPGRWAASADLMELNITMDWPVVPGVTPQVNYIWHPAGLARWSSSW